MAEATSSTRYRVEGMDCPSCATRITSAVRRVPGVKDVSVSVTAGTMTVRHGPDAGIGEAVMRQVGTLGGYSATPLAPRAVPVAEVHDHHGCCGHDHDHHGHGHAKHSHARHDHARGGEAGLHGHLHDHGPVSGPWWRSPRGLLTIGCGLALGAAYLLGKVVPELAGWAFTAAMLVGLVPIARRAFVSAQLGAPFSIEMLMVIAATGATIIGATEEAAAVVLLFLIGELLEGVAAGRARASIQALAKLVPATALLERNGRTEEVPAATLPVGATILIRPGDRIAADGEILEGESAIDEAPVTGESTPKRKSVGDAVFAGTVNGDGVLRLRVTAAAEDNTIARVVRLVEEAQESKAPTERFIDRFSRYYTPAVLLVAALVAVLPPLLGGGAWGEWIYKGLAILLIGCPCALVISTPAAIAAGLSAGARRGLLMKGGAVLEGMGSIDVIALDKTGTLTEGRPVVTDLLAAEGDARGLLSRAAALEAGSSHPLALAILARARADGVSVPPAREASAQGGKGVTGRVGGESLFLGSPAAAASRVALPAIWQDRIEALNGEGKSVSVLLADGRLSGIIAMRDEPREDAKAGLAALKAMGVQPLMLTGDNRRTAEAIGATLGLPVRAELLPEDKQRIVREMQGQGRHVAKVGDGINDAPALAAADIGIAMGGGTDVALETADAAVLHGRVLDLSRMVALSRRTMGNIRQNIAIALGLKAVFLVTTILGITGLWPAILADTGATVLVTANAMRLLAAKL
ncbi:heavy metal translocating P-type ATPase [Roseomonas xinghualingensis]|uniref:heavy metal translocating P-type ATPase n=1 Tax=Roseomonas xinghualingensis TaxID=2986475 RepID=UPI0021F1E3C0|nr:heavy metal translocating P-type ATPase [Roseomonas sp. SXEYE001]MCV4207892.1 heavy metal translocating P-type ATPase [Roseomonas sp. SXEYE001]